MLWIYAINKITDVVGVVLICHGVLESNYSLLAAGVFLYGFEIKGG